MSDFNFSRAGQANGAGDDRALFEKKQLLRILAFLHTKCVTLDRFETERIENGKSASFPVIGRAGLGVHKVGGASVAGRKIGHNEAIVAVDDRVYSDVAIADVDAWMASYSLQSRYADEMSTALSKLVDYRNLIMAIKASRQAGRIPGVTPGGDKVVDANMRTDALALAKALFGGRTILDEKGVDETGSDTYAYLRPAQIALLVQNKDTINSLYGGEGSYADGTVQKIGGVRLTKTSHVPTANFADAPNLAATVATLFGPETSEDVIPAKFQINCANVVGVIANRSAVGTVKLRDEMLEVSRVHRDFGHLMTVSQLEGKDYLRPECAVELAVA